MNHAWADSLPGNKNSAELGRKNGARRGFPGNNKWASSFLLTYILDIKCVWFVEPCLTQNAAKASNTKNFEVGKPQQNC